MGKMGKIIGTLAIAVVTAVVKNILDDQRRQNLRQIAKGGNNVNKELVLKILAALAGTAAVVLCSCLENDVSEEVLKLCDLTDSE